MTNLVSRIDEKQTSLYYQYLQENAPKDINTVVSGIDTIEEEELNDEETFDLFSQIQSINGLNAQNLDFETPNETEQIIEEQTKKEEELIKKKNEEIFVKEKEQEIIRKQEESREALNETLDNKKKLSFSEIFAFGKEKALGLFKKKEADNEIDELLAMKEAQNSSKKEDASAAKEEIKEEAKAEVKKEESKKEKKAEKKKEVKEEEPDWKYLALHDEMTGLLNKKALESYNTSKLNDFSVIYFCINALNHINNKFGREKGDALIKNVGKSLNMLFPNYAYRIYGGEFAILFDGLSDETLLAQKVMSIDTQIKILSNNDPDMDMIYSVSIGEQIGTGRSLSEVVLETRQIMLAKRAEYEALHPEILGVSKPKEEDKKKDIPYDELLTKEQKQIKSSVRDIHVPVSKEKLDSILATIKENTYSIECIFMADASFNNLCIFSDVSIFLEMANNNPPDFSYLYILFPNGPQYLGSDPYHSEITHIFENIGKALTEGRIKSADDIKTIKGINIFENIIWDF